ncbi:Protein TMC-2, partial [Aphelenchoides avenae]
DGEDSDDEDNSEIVTKEQVLQAIRQKKEIIGKIRHQPWNMKRKRRTLIVAKRHLKRQEEKVDKLQLYKVELSRKFTIFSRWLENIKVHLIPWESKIKRIESHFGSVVSSYFTFLRWVLSVNIVISAILIVFVIIPEWLADSRMRVNSERYNQTRHYKVMPAKVYETADELNTVLDFGGYLQYSYLFYGYYSSDTYFGTLVRYRVPVAYFVTTLAVFLYSLFIILRKMASNTRHSKLHGGKAEQYVFSWKVITGWDFSIGNPETAGSLFKANVIKLQ